METPSPGILAIILMNELLKPFDPLATAPDLHAGGKNITDQIIKRIGPAVLLPIPTGKKGPKIPGWQKLTLSDMTPDWMAGLNHGNNIGVLLGAASGGLVSVDCDSGEFLESFLSENPGLNESLISRGARGGNVWLRMKGTFPKSGKFKLGDGAPWGEFRADGCQTVIYGKHPTGKRYTNNKNSPLAVEFASINWPDSLRLPWVKEPANSPVGEYRPSAGVNHASLVDRAQAYVDKMPSAIAGSGGHDATFNVCKVLCHDFALSDGDAWAVLGEYNARCVPPWSESDLQHKLEDAGKCDRAKRARGELAEDRSDSRTPTNRYERNERTKKGGTSFVNSFNSYPVEAPRLADDALFGLAGAIVKKIEPHTETHPAALLLQFLIGFGNMVGRNPYFVTEADRQHANLFGVIVGKSSRGRKGTSWGHARRLFQQADEDWVSSRIMGGLASGEGVIMELKDSGAEDEEPPMDKRLLLMESEFGSVLRVMQKDGNTLSSTLRNSWDTGTLRNLANKNRDKKGSSLRATNCHISIIGHITRTELSKLLDENDSANGFANRFLWIHSCRSKLLPDGGNIAEVSFEKEIIMVQECVRLAQQRGEMKRTDEAREYWHIIYPILTDDHPGRWGQVTSRGEAQVVRLALVFSLLDGGEHITLNHLKAAEAVWNYCSESARWAFTESRFSRPAQQVLTALEQGPLSLTDISRNVFSGNAPRTAIEGIIREIKELTAVEKLPTGGRNETRVSLRN